MAKNNLVISDDEKYGSSPGMALGVGSAKSKAKPKHAPTLELTGAQVEALFPGGTPKFGDTVKFTATGVVKGSSAGETYGTELPGANSKAKVTLSVTHAEPMEAGADDEPDEDEPEDKPDAEAEDEPDTDAPAAPAKETMSPSDALGEEP